MTPMPKRERYIRARVRIEYGPGFNAYIEETRYQMYGSVYPLFPHEEAMRILKMINAVPDNFSKMNYDSGADRFEYCDFAADEIVRFSGEDVETNEGPKHLYPIGTYDWQWQIATPPKRQSTGKTAKNGKQVKKTPAKSKGAKR